MMTGGHWFVFQSVAWMNMIIEHSQEESWQVAISKTFDGRHPCPMCHAIERGRQQEQQENKSLPGLRLEHLPELFLEVAGPCLSLPSLQSCGMDLCRDIYFDGFLSSPPTPPPRLG